ncbi:MAG: KPN_02809 family neutral zinc metallopeptidase [Solirubrobacterales bacterium]
MKWRRTKSRDVIDVRGAGRRSRSRGIGGLGGGRVGIPRVGGGLGLIVVLVIVAIQVFGGGGGGSGFGIPPAFPDALAPGADSPQLIPASEDPQRDLRDFSVYVFEDAQRTWAGTFARQGEPYDNAKLVLYSGAVDTGGCGGATSAVGPFYCPADGRVYLDLSFYEDMRRQLGASGDFAWAYVIAHEMGHHVQQESGTSEAVNEQRSSSPSEANALSVRLELQADCYAGVWGTTVFEQGDLERGDLVEAQNAAAAVGDDRLQRRAGSGVNPDSFTHGTSEQRRRWFMTGFRGGDPGECDTFSAATP